ALEGGDAPVGRSELALGLGARGLGLRDPPFEHLRPCLIALVLSAQGRDLGGQLGELASRALRAGAGLVELRPGLGQVCARLPELRGQLRRPGAFAREIPARRCELAAEALALVTRVTELLPQVAGDPALPHEHRANLVQLALGLREPVGELLLAEA